MEEMYAKFNTWKEKFQKNIVDMGGKLARTGKIVTSEGATDGPFVEAKELIGGFMIVSAASMEEAIEIARQSPTPAIDELCTDDSKPTVWRTNRVESFCEAREKPPKKFSVTRTDCVNFAR
jgi:hypothetical protein